MFLTYLGHSTIYFGNNDYQVVIDPFLSGNPQCTMKVSDLKVSHVLVTHGHADHLGDALELCRREGVQLIANYEICRYAQQFGVENVIALNIGGTAHTVFGAVKMVAAAHSSTIEAPDGQLLPGGLANGYMVDFFHRRFYHAGDTGLTFDMKLLRNKKKRIDIAFLPVGCQYTMDVHDALIATKWLKPKVVIPIHYNTFPEITVSLKPLQRAYAKGKTRCKIMKPGATVRGSYEKKK